MGEGCARQRPCSLSQEPLFAQAEAPCFMHGPLVQAKLEEEGRRVCSVEGLCFTHGPFSTTEAKLGEEERRVCSAEAPCFTLNPQPSTLNPILNSEP